jgi:hypothetical protein
MSATDESSAQRAVETLHREVDAAAAAIAEGHGARLRCGRGCSACCVDDLTVFEVEAERIRRAHPALLDAGVPGPPGGCAFLGSQGECRVYAERPYVCRTQGLPLRWLEELEDGGAIVERRDICELNLEGPALESLPEASLWQLGPFEQRLATLQHSVDGGQGRRVALRSLFRAGR